MELLIVLGLCFGAYELLGVFQGCFQYNEHQLPYQPHHHFKESFDTKDDNEETLSKANKEQQCEESEVDAPEAHETSDEQNLDSVKSGPCSCYSTADDIFDDDTKTILRSSKKSIERKRFVFDKPISKFTVSASLMSLNRDESNLFNYIDDVNNNKFYKFRGEDEEIAETTFNRISSTEISNDDKRGNKRHNSSDIALYRKHNEHSENSSSVNVDINNKKIFFISAAT